MNRLPQNDLFPSERPVRSDYAREISISYARRRQITVWVLLTLLGLGAYALWGGGASTPKDVPTIAGEAEYKQKPADPGGIDIPHQDVRVYDQLEGKGGAKPAVEHLLPPPEAPKEAARPTASAEAPAPSAAPVGGVSPKTDLDPAATVKAVETTVSPATVAPSPTAAPAPAAVSTAPVVPAPATPAPAPIAAAVAKPAPASAPVVEAPKPAPVVKAAPVPKAQTLTIEQIIANTKSSAAAKTISNDNAASNVDYAIQLASVASEAQAKETMDRLQSKYASELGGAKLHVVRADLGSQGIYYRIRSDGLSKDEANRICSSLKRVNAGCILVGK